MAIRITGRLCKVTGNSVGKSRQLFHEVIIHQLENAIAEDISNANADSRGRQLNSSFYFIRKENGLYNSNMYTV